MASPEQPTSNAAVIIVARAMCGYTPEPGAGTGGAHNAMDELSVDEVIARESAFRAAVARRQPEFDEPLPPKGSYRRRFG